MTKQMKIIVCATLSFMFLFTTIGYSALTDSLTVSGTAEVDIPSGLFITNITTKSQSNIDRNTVSFIDYSTTVESTISRSSGAGSVTYEITVYNNTAYEYAYRGLYYQSDVKNNSNVSTSNGNSRLGVVTRFPNGRVVDPGEYLVFEVTYTVGRNLSASTNFETILNYQFGINVESEAAAREAVHEKFLDILNTNTTYETLVDALDNKYDGANEWTSNYIGNVSNAVNEDSMAVETLFAGQLNMIINGQTKPASVIIKHENLDNNTMTGDDYVATNSSNGGVFRGYGCEMTMYLTTDELDTRYGYATVYVTVFTCNRDENGSIIGDWYKIGDTYVGEANIVGYNGEEGGTGSFVTDNWVANAATYSPVNAYSYIVNSGVTIKQLVQTVDNNAITAFQTLLERSKAMIDDLTYAGTGIDIVEEAYEAASRYYTVDANGNPIATNGITRAQLVPVMSDLDYALIEAQKVIDSIVGQG